MCHLRSPLSSFHRLLKHRERLEQKMDIEQETESVANNKAVPSKRKKKMKNREEAEALQSKRKKKNTEETEAVAVRTSNQVNSA
ncbi:hypothetical protein P8452_49817 [Trifolium repens]|nr:hypothetical protein P8452_49817 [Trifolium repens]